MSNPLRLGIDGRAFSSPAGGVRRYVSELYGAMARLPDVELLAIGARSPSTLPDGVAAVPARSLPTNLGWMGVSLPLAARTARVDVFHAPDYKAPLWGVHPQAVTIHDVSYERHPEWDAYRNDPIRRWFYHRGALAADRVITDSAFSRDEIHAAYGIPLERIDVVPLAAASHFAPGAFEPSLAPAGVRQPYALHVGDLHVRRNLATALEAVLRLRAEFRSVELRSREFRLKAEATEDPPREDPPREDPSREDSSTEAPRSFRRQAEGEAGTSSFQPRTTEDPGSFRLQAESEAGTRTFRLQAELSLVCAGIDRGEGEKLRTRAAADPGALVMTGAVSEETLVNLYRGAAMLVYPSRYEGFGLPVLEAMQSGVPVIAARAASVPEIAGDAAMLLDPLDTAAWQAAIARVLTDADHAAGLRRAGLARAAEFSWVRTARETLAVLRRCVTDRRQ